MSNKKHATITNILDHLGHEHKDAKMRIVVEGCEGYLMIDGCYSATGEESGEKYLVINVLREDHDAFIDYNLKINFGKLVKDEVIND